MSRLQEAVDRFAADWQARAGEKPSQDTLLDGVFCAQTSEPFCLCLKLATGIGAMIDFTGLTCAFSGKPVTVESYEWMDEARRERAAIKKDDSE